MLMANPKPVVRVAAIGDVHCCSSSAGALQPLFAKIAESADVLALCGDLTNHGLPEEGLALVKELSAVKLPTVAVLGNHDYESGHPDELKRILTDAGVFFLDGEAKEIHGVGFAGVKGFGGGFGRGTLSAFGEPATKRFVQEALDEVMKLEAALQRLHTPQRIVVMHYSPIRATVEGEPPEIFPYLGCGRFEEPLNRYQVAAAVHGHAHAGAAEGRTSTGVPVYNVAVQVMRRVYPDRPPFRLLNLHPTPPAESPTPVGAERGAPVETEVG